MRWFWVPAACTLALDGERQMEINENQKISVRLTNRGTSSGGCERCLRGASQKRYLSNTDQSPWQHKNGGIIKTFFTNLKPSFKGGDAMQLEGKTR
jgi:hypothetical protein